MEGLWEKTGQWLFAQECTFVKGATKTNQLPGEHGPEVAFVGRSNVGKSSLINALTNRKKMARVSATPGRTQEINFFNLGGYGLLVDLPGYGYARVSKEKRLEWGQFVVDYLKGRSTLKRVYILIDARHGIKPLDEDIFKVLNQSAVSYQIVLTKVDKVTTSGLKDVQERTLQALNQQPAAHPQVLLSSATTLEGLSILKTEIAQLLLPEPRS